MIRTFVFPAGLMIGFLLPAPLPAGGPAPDGATGPPTLVAYQKQKVKKRAQEKKEPDVIYLPTPQDAVEAMLRLAKVKKGEKVYDLGCGDGRIVVTAAKKFGARGFGFDIDPERVRESRANVKREGVQDRVTIEQKDIFTLDLRNADVVTLYLLPELNVRLIPQLEKLKPGARIVSHAFAMEGVKPDKVIEVPYKENDGERTATVYLWTVPLKKEK